PSPCGETIGGIFKALGVYSIRCLALFCVPCLRRGTVPDASSQLQPLPFEARELMRSEEHTSELQSRENLVCRLLLEKKKHKKKVGAPVARCAGSAAHPRRPDRNQLARRRKLPAGLPRAAACLRRSTPRGAVRQLRAS